jgi:hypothetical protein
MASASKTSLKFTVRSAGSASVAAGLSNTSAGEESVIICFPEIAAKQRFPYSFALKNLIPGQLFILVFQSGVSGVPALCLPHAAVTLIELFIFLPLHRKMRG